MTLRENERLMTASSTNFTRWVKKGATLKVTDSLPCLALAKNHSEEEGQIAELFASNSSDEGGRG